MKERRQRMAGSIMNKSKVITQIQETIYYLRIQNYTEGTWCFTQLLQEMQKDSDISAKIPVLTEMMQALESTDMVLLADLLEEALLPLIKDMVVPKEPIVRENYCLETTSSGGLTVRHLPTNLYLHGNSNPMEEARILVKHCFDPKKENYAVWGIGLGYHVARLYEAAKGAVWITVFEEDKEMLKLAAECGILNHIPAERITYILDKTGEEFARYLSQHDTKHDAGILLHFPSIKKIQDKLLKDRMSRFFLGWNSMINARNSLIINFRSNQKYCSHNVDEIEERINNREVVLVAAGPSLDNSMDFLREASREKVIVAVARVWKKLLDEGIVPDYVVTMDAHEITMKQMEGIDNEDVPLIVDSTAYWGVAVNYGGEKYIAYQKDYENAERRAKESGHRIYETGGSVLTLCLDIVLQLGAKVVYFAGADLAYPGGWSHVSGTMNRMKMDISAMRPVEAVDGNIVYADYSLIGFRKWIEGKISEYPRVKFYNLSNCGAKIAGTHSVYGRQEK